jgi:MFS family permease
VSAPLSVLTRNRDFRRLFAAELVIFGGDWFVIIPLLGLLARLSHGGLLGALTLAADTGITALLLPFAGTVADRYDRRKIMVTANLCAIGAVLLLFFVRNGQTAWLGPVAVGAMAVAKAFYSPAAQAAVPNLVEPEDLSGALAVAGSAWGTMTVVGASLGGVLAAALSPYTCFVVTAVGLSLAAALALGVRRPMQSPREPAAAPPRPFAALREALRYLAGHPRVRALVTVKSAVGVGNGVLAIYPALAVLLHVGSLGTGLFFALRGLGALVGPLLLRSMYLRRSGWLLAGLSVSMSVYGLAYLGVAAVPWFPLVLLLILLAHMAGGGNWAMSNVALAAAVPDELRGRVFSVDLMLATVAIASSQILVGLLIDHTPPRLLIAACGATTLLYAIGWRAVVSRTRAGEPASAQLSS